MILKWKKLNEKAVIPKRQTESSAGFDLVALCENPVVLKIGEIKMIHTGVCVEPSEKEVALFVYARSGLAYKHGITLANSVGVIDSDYRGEIMVPLINLGKEDFVIESGMRIAQLVCQPVIFATSAEVRELSETKRGENGFGSSGIK